VDSIDGLLLQGGVDMAPIHYGEEPLRPEWAGDAIRDGYEMELVRVCMELDRPVLGVCRGAQVLNVALGGSLYQDVETLHPERRVHRNWEIYDQHFHEVALEPGSRIEEWYANAPQPARINSVHHQCLARLGRGLVVEARSMPDGVVEAVRYEAPPGSPNTPFAYGVQWHPEFMQGLADPIFLDPKVLMSAFLAEVDARTGTRTPARRSA